jgi:hypothetical protein
VGTRAGAGLIVITELNYPGEQHMFLRIVL